MSSKTHTRLLSGTVNMTEGNIIKHLIVFSMPMLIGNIFQQLYNLVDSVVVGQFVGPQALGSIGVTMSLNFFFFAICNGIGSGGGVITSQFFGSGADSKVKKCITNTAYLMLIFPLTVGIISFFLVKPLLILLQTEEDLMADAVLYAQIMCLGLVLVSLYNYVSSMLRALGDSKTPLYFLIFSCILNTILDVVFVKCFGLGVFGAAVATLISQFVSGVASLVYAFLFNPYFKLKKEDFKLDTKILLSAVKIGIPMSLQFSLIAISCMALQRVVNGFGWIAVTAFTATSRIEQIIHQPYQTLSAALSTFCGQNYGAKNSKRLIKGYRQSMLLMAIFTAIMMPLIIIFGKGIIGIFVDTPVVIMMGAKALRITCIYYIFLGTIYMTRGILNGIGDAFFAILNGVVEVIGRIAIPILLVYFSPYGAWSIWRSVGLVWFISALTALIRYFAVKKRKIQSVDSEFKSVQA